MRNRAPHRNSLSALRSSTRIRTALAELATFAVVLAVAVGASPSRADGLRDPTRPATLGPSPVLLPAGDAPLRLEAILGAGESGRVIVNGRVVRRGETIAAALITSVGIDSIHYVRAGREYVARLPSRKIAVRSISVLQAGEP